MRLFIAEKPSLGHAIAEGLGQGRPRAGYIDCGQDLVTWCFGHILEQYDPEEYDPTLRQWRRDMLPIIPEVWKLKPKADAANQLAIIRGLLQQAERVVHAGDPDREGQLLVDEVLEYFNYQGTVERIWLSSLDSRSVNKALATMGDNAKRAPLRDAARARSQADWLIGLNATRAMSILGKECGRKGVLSLGRVQTPTLALIVQRDQDIAYFKPIGYYVLQARFAHDADIFTATFVPSATQAGLDSEGRLTDLSVATAITESARGVAGQILDVQREIKKKPAPLPHCLSSLQKAASAKLGMTAQAVLDTAQSLYEKKLTTYPRSDCRYLPSEQYSDATHILSALSGIPGLEQAVGNAHSDLCSTAWDTSKVTAHHAIIPTGELPATLTETEHALYLMIAMAYCIQFYPPLKSEAQKIVVGLTETRWEARARCILDAGWTQCTAEDDDKEKDTDEQSLISVAKGDAITCSCVEILKKKTSPPARFTEGTLIEAMANIHRFVSNAQAKETLKENEGIGTEATRASILETLKARRYIVPDKKALTSTLLGKEIIGLTPNALKDPVTTALWESRLEAIATGTESLQTFMVEQVRALPELLSLILNISPKLVPGAFPCPTCGKALAQRKGKDGSFFWSCASYPDCKQPTLPDDNGKPGKRKTPVASEFSCPLCGNPLYARQNPRGQSYWACFNKEGHTDAKPVFLPDDNGKPGTLTPRSQVSAFKCAQCGAPLLHKVGTSKAGKPYDFFSCTGYPECRASYDNKGGQPNFEGK